MAREYFDLEDPYYQYMVGVVDEDGTNLLEVPGGTYYEIVDVDDPVIPSESTGASVIDKFNVPVVPFSFSHAVKMNNGNIAADMIINIFLMILWI